MNIVFEFYYVFIRDTNEFTFSEFMRYISPFRSDSTETYDIDVHLVSRGLDTKVVFKLPLNKDAFEDPDVMLNLYFSLFNQIKKLEDDTLISSTTSECLPITLFVTRIKENYLKWSFDSQDDLVLKEGKVKIDYIQHNYFIDDEDELIDLTKAFKDEMEEGEGEQEGQGEGE